MKGNGMASIAFWTASHLPDIGGFQWSTYRLARFLKGLGHNPLFVTRRSDQGLLSLEVPEIRFGSESVQDWVIESGNWLLTHRSEFDVIHAIDCFFNAVDEQLMFFEQSKLPTVLKIPTQGCFGKLMSSPSRVLAFGKISAFSVLNPGISEELALAGMNPRKFWSIPNGIDSEEFKPCRNRAELRHQLELPEQKILLLYAGRLVHRKRLDTLLAAMELASPQITLVIVGSGFGQHDSVEDGVYRKATGMKNVLLRKPVSNVLPYFQSCDIHILLSEREGMPNSVLEGMSCALPTIATAIPGLREIVSPDVDGFLIPVGNVQAAAEAISTLAENDSMRESMGLAARKKILRKYDIGIIASAYEAMYKHICLK